MPTFTNQATLTYTGGTTTSNVVAGELTRVLTVTKDAVGESYRPGDSVTYVVSFINSGTTPLTALTLSDNLGAYTAGATTVTPLTYRNGTARFFVNGVEQAAPTVTAGPPMTVTGINIPAGGNAQLIYATTVNNFAPPEATGSIDNTATVTGGPLTEPVTATESLAASAEPELSVVKSLNPATVTEGGLLTYTFTIQNTGSAPAEAADNVVISDIFDPALNITSVTLDSAALTSGTDYTYDTGTGTFNTVAGRITVPAASYTQDPTTGAWSVTPGTTVLAVTGIL